MKIESVIPRSPRQIVMTFPTDEAWVLIAALRDYAIANPGAVCREDWKQWATDLDKEARRG